MNTTIIIGILLMLPLGYGVLFQARPKDWIFKHASIAMLEIVVFVLGLALVLISLFA